MRYREIIAAAVLACVSAGYGAPVPIEPPVEVSAAVESEEEVEVDEEEESSPDAAKVASFPPDDPRAPRLNEFQGDELGLVLRTLARQARVNLVVSDRVSTHGGTVTLRLEEKTPREAIDIIVVSKGLVSEEVDGITFIKSAEEVPNLTTAKTLDDMTRRLAAPLARFTGTYYKELIAAGVPAATAHALVLREEVSRAPFRPPTSQSTREGKVDGSSPEWMKESAIGLVLGMFGLGFIEFFSLLFVHLALAVAVFARARARRKAGLPLTFFGPLLWAATIVAGGVFMAAFYWVTNEGLHGKQAFEKVPAVPS